MSYRDRLQHRLDETGRPLRVGLVGAGQMGTGLAAQLLRMPGITLSAVLDVQKERAEDALGQWRTVKEAASEAIIEGGGTITHHHGVGHDHLPWMRAEVGELGLELLRAAKERLDPAGVMNPGKLLPD